MGYPTHEHVIKAINSVIEKFGEKAQGVLDLHVTVHGGDKVIDRKHHTLYLRHSSGCEYGRPDALVFVRTRLGTAQMSIRSIFEIEETHELSPKQLFGNFFATALADYYDPGDFKECDGDIYIMDQSAKFIQVMNIDKLKNRDAEKRRNKIIQWKAIEKSINNMLPIGKIQEYKMFLGYTSQFEESGEKWNDIVNYVEADITEAFKQYQE